LFGRLDEVFLTCSCAGVLTGIYILPVDVLSICSLYESLDQISIVGVCLSLLIAHCVEPVLFSCAVSLHYDFLKGASLEVFDLKILFSECFDFLLVYIGLMAHSGSVLVVLASISCE
jgi:hypothetical protein